MLVHPTPLIDLTQNQVTVTENCRQDVVEIVRYSTCEASDGVHLLRLQQFFFEPFPFRDITGDRRKPRNSTAFASNRRVRNRDVDFPTVLSETDGFVVRTALSRLHGRQGLRELVEPIRWEKQMQRPS